MHISEFIDAHKLTLEATPVGTHVIDGNTPFKWEVTLTMGNKKCVFPYKMGAAHVVYKSTETAVSYHTLLEKVKQVRYGERLLMGLSPAKPTISDVLGCIQLDCQTIEDSDGFGSWASDLGYNSDSIKDKAIYDACVAEYFKVKAFFGLDFQTFLSLECE